MTSLIVAIRLLWLVWLVWLVIGAVCALIGFMMDFYFYKDRDTVADKWYFYVFSILLGPISIIFLIIGMKYYWKHRKEKK